MFDFDLQMRFWRSATEAVMQWSQASIAAATEFQEQAQRTPPGNSFRPQPQYSAPLTELIPNPWAWTMAWWQAVLPQNAAPSRPAMPSFNNGFANPWGFNKPSTTDDPWG